MRTARRSFPWLASTSRSLIVPVSWLVPEQPARRHSVRFEGVLRQEWRARTLSFGGAASALAKYVALFHRSVRVMHKKSRRRRTPLNVVKKNDISRKYSDCVPRVQQQFWGGYLHKSRKAFDSFVSFSVRRIAFESEIKLVSSPNNICTDLSRCALCALKSQVGGTGSPVLPFFSWELMSIPFHFFPFRYNWVRPLLRNRPPSLQKKS